MASRYVKVEEPGTQKASPALMQKNRYKKVSGDTSGEVPSQPVAENVQDGEKRGFFDRAGDTLRGTVSRQESGYAGALEKLTAGLGRVGSRIQDRKDKQQAEQDRQYLAKYQQDLADALAAGDEKAAKTAQLRINSVKYRLKTNGDMGDYFDQVNDEAVQKLDAIADKKGAESVEAFQRAKDGAGVLGGLAVDAGSALADVLGDAGANSLAPGLGTILRVVRGFGNASEAAEEKGFGLGTQVLYGAGMAGIGEGVNRLFGGNPILEKATGKGALDDLIMPTLGKTLPGRMVKSGLGEGIEEGAEDILDALYQRAILGEKADPFSWKETGYDALVGGIVGGLTGISKPSLTDENGNWYDADGKKHSSMEMDGQKKTTSMMEADEPVRVGRATVLKNPYHGQTPTYVKPENAMAPAISRDAVDIANQQIDKARALETETGKSFRNFLTDFYELAFQKTGGARKVPVLGVEMDGEPYEVSVSKNAVGKVISDKNMSAEKLAVFDMLDDIVQNGEYVGSNEYHQKGRKKKDTIRFDMFETPVTIDGRPYIVTFDVEVFPSTNNYRTHKVINEMDLVPAETTGTGTHQPQIQAAQGPTSEGSSPFKTGDRESGNPGGDVPSENSVTLGGIDVKNNRSTEVTMPRAVRSDAEIEGDLQRIRQEQAQNVETVRQVRSQPGDSETDGYMEALAQDENELIDPVTPADIVYDAKLRGLQREDALPERRKEPISKEDMDELVKLYQDIASPVETARSARFQESEGLVRARSEKERKSVGERGREAKSYFMRKMVDAGDSVTKLGNAVKDSYLYPFYNMARSSASAGVNMIQSEQTDITGKKVGKSLNDIFNPIREQGDAYYEQFQTYMFDLHNIDRMSLVTGENTAKLEAEMALHEFDRENPDVATLTEARLQRKASSIDPEEAALAKERLRLLRKLNQADRMGNKPVFGYEVTADMSKERSDRLLREHPEFAQYQNEVRTYIKNLMQYRVDSGLLTAEDAAFLEKYYPNYVPTFRMAEKPQKGRDRRYVRVGRTVGLAEGGNQKLVPLHEALGKQTMQVVREGGKNRFGARLLEDFNSNSQNEKVRQYILDAREYESDFSTETFDQPDAGLKKDNTFAVYKDGKKYEMTLDPSMFDAVKALYPDVQESNIVIKAIRAGNNLFKALVTGYNPTFTIRNTVRDLQTAGLYSRDAVAFAKNYPLALKEIATNGDYWRQYKALGGSFSSVFDYQTGTVNEPDGKVAKMAAKMEAVNMAMEQAPRLAEFMSVVKAGDGSVENLMDAMYAAADVTVNFGRAGTLGKVLNANFVPFLNPGIQGFDKMVRRVTETKGSKEWAKLVVRAAALGVAPTIINALLYSDDEEWEELKDSDKDTNYLFKIGDGVWLKIPKGRELSILGMTADRMQDIMRGENVNWGDFITTVGNQVAPANPLRQNILAAWFDTDLFDASNPGRTWYGGNIESQRLQNYAPGERYDSSTDVFSKWFGKQLNLSPKKINYLLDQYSGVVGDFLLPLLTPQAERDPFTKAFTVDSVSSNRINGDFYEKSDDITYAKNGGDATAKVTNRFWNKQQTACSDIYKEIREIENSELTDAEKKQKVREARAVLNGIQKNALSVLDTYQTTVEKYLRGTSEEALDYAYREANRECFGAEYALQVYNKDTYVKAKEAKKNGVSYDDFYTYYFDTKNYSASGGKSVVSKKMEYLKKSNLSENSKAELYFADLANDSDLKKQAELENASGISAVQYWQYKVATAGMTKKAEKLAAIDSLNLASSQKTALYYANNWAESTLDEAPWYGMPDTAAKNRRYIKRRYTKGSEAGIIKKHKYVKIES